MSFMLKPLEAILQLVSKIPKIGDKVMPALEKIQAFREGLDEGLLEPDEENKVANVPAAQTAAQTERYEEINKQQLDISLKNKTDKDVSIDRNPSMIPVTTNTF